jgi:hypothetical protein
VITSAKDARDYALHKPQAVLSSDEENSNTSDKDKGVHNKEAQEEFTSNKHADAHRLDRDEQERTEL